MRTLHDFHGGIHPPENKVQSNRRPIRSAGIPPRLIIPLQQHIGAPAVCRVSPGDRVLKGERLADAQGRVSVPVHAPTSGIVHSIELHPVPHPSGEQDWCILLDSDGEDIWAPLTPCDDYTQRERDEILARIRDAGVAGMGGAGFPTEIKLHPPAHDKVNTLILNGAECEPYITADDRLMRERALEVVRGLEIMAWLLRPAECLIGIEDNKPEAIAALREAVSGTRIEIVVVPTKYPSGGEKQLVQILTGLEIPHGHIPADVGVMCQNVGTAVAVYRAVVLGEPLISRITTVTGEAVREAGNFEVLIGTPVEWLLARAGFMAERAERLVLGGPMMGFTLHDTATPITKTSNCVIAASASEMPVPAPAQACIRCSLCAQACPMELLPQQLYWFARAEDWTRAEHHNLFDCIECGACAYVCPSQIPLVQYYRHAKGEIRTLQAEQSKSDKARERFEARQARLAREAEEKEAKRRARAQAAAQAQAAKQPPTGSRPETPAPESASESP